MNLYREYIKEREGKGLVETAHGFATYKIDKDECYICDIYVKKEFRKEGVASELADKITEIAKSEGCKFLSGSVCPSLKGATVSLKSQLQYGFKLHSSHDDFIILRKDI